MKVGRAPRSHITEARVIQCDGYGGWPPAEATSRARAIAMESCKSCDLTIKPLSKGLLRLAYD